VRVILKTLALLAALPAFSIHAAVVSFAWTQNSETNLAGYNLYYGPASRTYTNHVVLGKVGACTISNLADGATYYFAIAAFNSNNLESVYSTELQYPNAPVLGAITNRTISEDTTVSIPVSISDVDTPLANLTLSATSSNLVLVPASNITFSGTSSNRTMTVRPAPDLSGSVGILVTLSDGVLTTNRSFVLTVTAVPDAPTISQIASVTTDEDVFTGLISFTVSDADTAATNLTVRALSSNPTLIPTNRIVLAGTNNTRTVQLQATTNQYGSATITLTVSDPGGLSASTNFNFTVRSINDLPTITQITNRTLLEDEQTTISFAVSDVETAWANLQVTATSSTASVVPAQGLVLGVSGTNHNLTVTPATNAVGSTTITVTVNDGTASTSRVFTVTYQAVNDLPFVSQPSDLTVNKPNPVPTIPFTIWDAETTANQLVITLTSTNTTLLPTNNMTVSGNGTNRVLTLTPVANQFGTTRIVIRVSDPLTNSRVGFLFTYTGSNNPPVLTVPGPLAGNAGAAIAVQGIRVSDLDVGTNNLNLTLSAANGTLSVSTSVPGGVRANQVSSNNSANVTIAAPLTALNTTLTNTSGLTYTSRADFGGTEMLVVTVSDNGFSGSDGAKTDTKTIAIQVAGSLQTWRATYFTAADLQNPAKEATVWGDFADPDNDGRHNLMEFALGLNPLGSEPQELVFVTQIVNQSGNQYLTLTYNSRIAEPLLQYVTEVSADNVTWSATAQRTANIQVNPQFERVTYQDTVPITSETARFMRLRVVKNSP
jgi:Big-like domain-containing protein